jgi:hypothetical protein
MVPVGGGAAGTIFVFRRTGSMNVYWVYDIPNWLFWLISVGAAIAFGLAGMFAMRSWVRRPHGGHCHNDIVSVFFASMSVFYGVAVGLFALGAWQTYSEVDSKLALESATMAQLYRDLSHYPEPARATLQGDLRVYVRKLIDVSWPQFRRGIVDTANNNTLNAFYDSLAEFEPATETQKLMHGETLRQFDRLIELRHLLSVTVGLPRVMWVLVIVGAIATLASSWFFDTRSLTVHFWLTVLLSALLGMMIHLLASMDNPFRGDYCVTPDSFEMLYHNLMAGGT